jgi:hypothetical protein
VEIKNEAEISLIMELYYIVTRALICQLRNPMDVFFKIIQAVFTAVIVFLVFGDVVINAPRLAQLKSTTKQSASCKTSGESSSSSSPPTLSEASRAPYLLFQMKDPFSCVNVSAKATRP